MNLFGYLMIYLAITGHISRPVVCQMYVYICIGANSQSFSNTGALVTCVKNFPESRGIALGSAAPSSPSPFAPLFGAKGVFQAAAVVYWAYTGFDMVATLAEETKNPAKDIPLGLIGSMSAIIIVYTVMALVLVMMQKYSDLDPNAAYSIAFASVGMKWREVHCRIWRIEGDDHRDRWSAHRGRASTRYTTADRPGRT
ncbi:uncharacterized protein A4U43_C01F24930 [Asparagus officinalis]|uniref:Nodulin-like domain-containing protein n=1 Tax=Asparagus officinalis TaxID=4686 RepID=A0A5P1FTR8_ASPOF|nr:uncharacterized protein A4U43_C01F24930 [Asparagus officinalis]